VAAAALLPQLPWAARLPLRSAARPVTANGTSAYSLAMHVHSSFSEYDGSMDAQLWQAAQNAVDVLWWTDHDQRLNDLDYRKTVHFTSLTDEQPAPGEGMKPWKWSQKQSGPVVSGSGSIVQNPCSPHDPVAGGGAVPGRHLSFFDSAIAAKANGIATTVITSNGLTAPVSRAMSAGIPVVSYNADGTVIKGVPDIGTNRLCYVGQALYESGIALGKRIKSLITPPGDIVIFIATPGTGNLQPRSDAAASVLTPAGFKVSEIATGAATNAQEGAENAYILAHKSTLKGAFAVDAGSTEFLGPVLAKNGLAGKIPAGGFDLTPGTLSAIKAGQLDFTSTRTPICRASCRRSTSTCSTCRAAWRHRRTPRPA
jgi:hypothetical protein